jgi:hypothetical protein
MTAIARDACEGLWGDRGRATRSAFMEGFLLVMRLQQLTPEVWQRTAEHGEYSHYSVLIMFRHLAFHDFFHAYRIEELLLKKGVDGGMGNVREESAVLMRLWGGRDLSILQRGSMRQNLFPWAGTLFA